MKINQIIVDNFEKINSYFNLELRAGKKYWQGRCKIHDGDNDSALVVYNETGKWRCYTCECHIKYGSDPIGFIRTLLSKREKNNLSHEEAVAWCENFFGKKVDRTPLNDDNKLTNQINLRVASEGVGSFKLTRQDFLNRLKEPTYYINRGYQKDTLNKYAVGFCDNPSKRFFNRVLVPVFDNNNEYIIGCLGRSIFEKCESCKGYHKPGICIKYGKWRNSENLPSESLLYNIGQAKNSIKESGVVILTEGSPNVWRLDEAGFPMSLACYGSKFTEHQKMLLDTTGAETIIIVPDAGKPGEIMVEHIKSRCKHTYNIVIIEPTYEDDVGKLNIETVKNIIGPVVDNRIKHGK